MKLGAVTAIAFEERVWDEWGGCCRLAVGTADGRVLLCEAVKEGSSGVKLSQSSKWSLALLPAPPGLAHGQQGGRVRGLDWSRCGRYLRACGEELRCAAVGRGTHTGLKEDNSWIRVWCVGAGGAAWEKGAALALAEGGGMQIFLHPLHLALVRAVEWCSGSCLERDSLFDLLLSERERERERETHDPTRGGGGESQSSSHALLGSSGVLLAHVKELEARRMRSAMISWPRVSRTAAW